MSRHLARLSDETATRFRDCRQATQERMGRTELCNDEFLTLLLDIYALHLEREGREAGAPRGGESQPIADGGDWVACEDCGAEYRSEQAARGCCTPTETRAFIPDGGQSTAGTERCWDHEDCPRDGCDGELQQQDQFNVMCLKCETVFTHQKGDDEHRLIHDCEFVARKPRAITDGGQPTARNHLADDGYADAIGRDDLDECWCCGGLHDCAGSLCADCDEAGCKHFSDGCESDHKPVLPDGGQSVDGTGHELAHLGPQFVVESRLDMLIQSFSSSHSPRTGSRTAVLHSPGLSSCTDDEQCIRKDD